MTDFENKNSHSIDYIKEVNHEILAHAEDVALGSLYQAVSHATSLGALNAVSAQQQCNVTAQAVTTMGATTLYSINTATDSLFVNGQKIPAKVATNVTNNTTV